MSSVQQLIQNPSRNPSSQFRLRQFDIVQMTGNRHNLSVEGSFHSVLLF
jgi:hypothetical protein